MRVCRHFLFAMEFWNPRFAFVSKERRGWQWIDSMWEWTSEVTCFISLIQWNQWDIRWSSECIGGKSNCVSKRLNLFIDRKGTEGNLFRRRGPSRRQSPLPFSSTTASHHSFLINGQSDSIIIVDDHHRSASWEAILHRTQRSSRLYKGKYGDGGTFLFPPFGQSIGLETSPFKHSINDHHSILHVSSLSSCFWSIRVLSLLHSRLLALHL